MDFRCIEALLGLPEFRVIDQVRLFAIIEAKLYGAPHQAKMRFRLLCSCRRPYAIRWISLILLLKPSVMPLV